MIPSVRTVDDLAGRLSRYLLLDSATISKALHDEEVCEKYGYNTQNISCMFIPNTYQVYWNISMDNLLDRMKKRARVSGMRKEGKKPRIQDCRRTRLSHWQASWTRKQQTTARKAVSPVCT